MSDTRYIVEFEEKYDKHLGERYSCRTTISELDEWPVMVMARRIAAAVTAWTGGLAAFVSRLRVRFGCDFGGGTDDESRFRSTGRKPRRWTRWAKFKDRVAKTTVDLSTDSGEEMWLI